MESFAIGLLTSLFTFGFSTSYLSKKGKHWFNRIFGNSVTDIVITASCLLLAGTATSGLMLTLGLGIGASTFLRISKSLWGTGK